MTLLRSTLRFWLLFASSVLPTIIGQSLSPFVNRQLKATVSAHTWPTTPQSLYCEAYVYYTEKSNAQQFLSNIARASNESRTTSYEKAWQDVMQHTPLDSSRQHLYKIALSIRAGSVTCETHRNLARRTLLEAARLREMRNGDYFMVVYPSGKVITTLNDYHSAVMASSNDKEVKNININDILLPDEIVYGRSSVQESDSLTVLYANLGTKEFAQAFNMLQSSNSTFVVRHLGEVLFEDGSTRDEVIPTVLQGYGVRLDIRNVEYKVFDDRGPKQQAGQEQDGDTIMQSDAIISSSSPNSYTAGVNLAQLGIQDDSSLQQTLQSHLEQYTSYEQLIPPVWQRRQLSLQATTVLLNNSLPDPLSTFLDITQNLPNLASTLVHIKVPEQIHNASMALEKDAKLSAGYVYVNGRPHRFDKPVFNMFDFLALLKEEENFVEQLERKLSKHLDRKGIQVIIDALIKGENFFLRTATKSGSNDDDNDGDDDDDDVYDSEGEVVYRVDVGRGGRKVIRYLNDIEKDAMYRNWPRSLQQMLMSMQFGMPPMVRRNIFTLLAVVDPLDSNANPGASVGLELIQSSFPIRVGILMVSTLDVQQCTQWLTANEHDEDEPCPVLPLFDKHVKKVDAMVDIPASTQAVHRLFEYFASTYGEGGGATMAYYEYLQLMLNQKKEDSDTGSLSMRDVISAHGELLEGLGMLDAKSAEGEAFKVLTGSEHTKYSELYGKALRFAAEKRIRPSMSFLNGRPLPETNEDNEVGKAVQSEQSLLFGMIVNGEISDSSPRNIYSKMLSGDNVFKSAHPLLFGGLDKSSWYKLVDHSYSAESLLRVSSDNPTATTKMLLEAYIDFHVVQDLSNAKNLINAAQEYVNENSDTSVDLAIRILPRTLAAAEHPLCAVFFNAKHIEGLDLVNLLESSISSNQTGISDLQKTAPYTKLAKTIKDKIVQTYQEEGCKSAFSDEALFSHPTVLANGRLLEIQNGMTLTVDDIELLMQLEYQTAIVVSSVIIAALDERVLVDKEVRSLHDAVSRSAALLSIERNTKARSRFSVVDHIERKALAAKSDDTKNDINSGQSSLMLNWGEVNDSDSTLATSIIAVIDPISYAAQRIVPVIKMLRDDLHLPVTVVFAPTTLLEGDARVPITSYYHFVSNSMSFTTDVDMLPFANFQHLATSHVLTLRMDVPEKWDVQQHDAVQDTDNLRCDDASGCSDDAYRENDTAEKVSHHLADIDQFTTVDFELKSLLFFGQCRETTGALPNGLQLQLIDRPEISQRELEVALDGTVVPQSLGDGDTNISIRSSDTLVMKMYGYWQLRANPGVWTLRIEEKSKGAEIFDIEVVSSRAVDNALTADEVQLSTAQQLTMHSFVSSTEQLKVKRRPGYERESLFSDDSNIAKRKDDDDVIHVFSLATGHLYERFLKIMMLSVTKRTSSRVKFWLFENFLSPSFKDSARYMARKIGCEVEFVTYKWPSWLREQTEKQRIIWGYKILFLDVLFPLDVKKIIYVDADQVIRADLKELWDMDLEGAPYGYTPFCTSRESTLGYQFWREGFWKSHLGDKPYHISALYVVDLQLFRRALVGDQLRALYQQLSANADSLANLDQDLPNYAQHQVPIFSLPQEWLWCESWCSDETKGSAKTIDLCNNPMHKEPKVSMAKRVISGPLFEESWIELDAEVTELYNEYLSRGNSSVSSRQ